MMTQEEEIKFVAQMDANRKAWLADPGFARFMNEEPALYAAITRSIEKGLLVATGDDREMSAKIIGPLVKTMSAMYAALRPIPDVAASK